MKILVISLAGIGDTLFATPLIHELRLNYPKATIEALVMYPGSRDLLEGNPHLDHVHQKNLLQTGRLQSLRFILGLRRGAYDLTINTLPQSKLEYRVIARLIGAPNRISHEYASGAWLNSWLVNRTLPQNYEIHCVENNLDLLRLTGGKRLQESHRYEIYLSPAEQEWADSYLREHQLGGRALLGMHVGSGATKNLAWRRWPLDQYAELLERLGKSHPDAAVLLLGGPQEVDDHRQLLARADHTRVVAPETRNLRQAAALLEKCRAFLSVDTSLMHLAAAMRVPHQVAIETPTWNKTVEPYNRPFTLVPNPAVAGRSLEFYRYDGKGIRGSQEEIIRCMRSVTVDAVHAALSRALGS
ncbi:MAG: glycosyltransferase family 9 protein [Verrucomicrobiota bacterium]